MPFTVAATSNADALTYQCDGAEAALQMFLELTRAGMAEVQVKDDAGSLLTKAELEALSKAEGGTAHPRLDPDTAPPT
jgi:hypothetical protein